jgi:predicted transcriptional regulator
MITFGAAIAVAAQPQAARQARRTGENDADETIPHLKRIRASPKTWHDIKATDAIAAIAAIAAEYALNELSGKRFRVAGLRPAGRRSLLRRRGAHIIVSA